MSEKRAYTTFFVDLFCTWAKTLSSTFIELNYILLVCTGSCSCDEIFRKYQTKREIRRNRQRRRRIRRRTRRNERKNANVCSWIMRFILVFNKYSWLNWVTQDATFARRARSCSLFTVRITTYSQIAALRLWAGSVRFFLLGVMNQLISKPNTLCMCVCVSVSKRPIFVYRC